MDNHNPRRDNETLSKIKENNYWVNETMAENVFVNIHFKNIKYEKVE